MQLELAIGDEIWARPQVAVQQLRDSTLFGKRDPLSSYSPASAAVTCRNEREESAVIQLFEVVRGAGFEPARHFWH